MYPAPLCPGPFSGTSSPVERRKACPGQRAAGRWRWAARQEQGGAPPRYVYLMAGAPVVACCGHPMGGMRPHAGWISGFCICPGSVLPCTHLPQGRPSSGIHPLVMALVNKNRNSIQPSDACLTLRTCEDLVELGMCMLSTPEGPRMGYLGSRVYSLC